ncbi:MAG TPA: CBS domain-containing protein, partial [Polyangiaceae bacterium]|nr:CBS domain-containing protein [Polyangiaceae bacterium]
PLARHGLAAAGVDRADADRLLGVVEARAAAGRTGASWALDSLAAMGGRGRGDAAMRALVRATIARQQGGEPVHRWAPAEAPEAGGHDGGAETVGEFMSTDLYTLRPDDLVELARCMMAWKNVRHLPVEDDEGALVGLVTEAGLGDGPDGEGGARTVASVMDRRPPTVAPGDLLRDAARLMRERAASGLPVIEGGRLVGVVTERDLVGLAEEPPAAERAPT